MKELLSKRASESGLGNSCLVRNFDRIPETQRTQPSKNTTRGFASKRVVLADVPVAKFLQKVFPWIPKTRTRCIRQNHPLQNRPLVSSTYGLFNYYVVVFLLRPPYSLRCEPLFEREMPVGPAIRNANRTNSRKLIHANRIATKPWDRERKNQPEVFQTEVFPWTSARDVRHKMLVFPGFGGSDRSF